MQKLSVEIILKIGKDVSIKARLILSAVVSLYLKFCFLRFSYSWSTMI